ncbi:MAG TPA: radical SAM protein [Bacteroidia bacterium]|nr:radical SAM protein [Bacteroidia bacterium]
MELQPAGADVGMENVPRGGKVMNILFSHSYFMRFDPKQWEQGQPFAPLGTLLAAAVLREKGHDVHLFDPQFSYDAEEVIPFLEKYSPDVFVIFDDGFNYLTKMCLTNMREAAFRMQELAKEKGCRVIVCSSDSSDHAEKYLARGADFVIRGEGEETLAELVDAIGKKLPFETISGISLMKDGALFSTPKRNVMKDLDALPLPAWDLAGTGKYKAVWKEKHGYFSINIATTRGCPYKCNWCAKPIYGNRYNSRSPENVIAELKMLKEKTAFDHVWFCDDIFGLKPGWVKRFAELVKENDLHFTYKIQTRADLLVQENYVRDLAASGCETAWMGAESGSQKILDAMDKGTTVEQIREATYLLKKHGIRPAFFLQFGYPGETMEDIRKTIALLNELLPDDIGISVSYPLPGTKFYENVKAEMNAKQNWSDSDDLALMFRHTFSPEFYRQLHRYVHRNYRKHQGYESLKQFVVAPWKVKKKDFRRAASVFWYLPVVQKERKRLAALSHEQH